jgi:hypothetical protein
VPWHEGGDARERELREQARGWALVSLFLVAAVVAFLAYVLFLK